MKTGKILKKITGLGMAAVMCLSFPGVTAFAAERTNPEYIDMYVSGDDTSVVRNRPEVVKKIAEDLFAHKSEIDLRSYNLPEADSGVFAAALAVYPELFFVERSFRYGYSGSYLTKIYPTYLYSESETAAMLEEFYNEADLYLEKVSGKLSKCGDDFSKALVLHDELALDAHYDLNSKDDYNFMINKKGVCENYSRVYAYLLAQCGIYCEIVDSTAMNHEWMKLKLDGEYYNVDLTWDDPEPDSPGRVRHSFFLLSDTAIQQEIEKATHYSYSSLHSATSTKYDSYNYHSFYSKMCKLSADDTLVYTIGSSGIVKYDYSSNSTTNLLSINDKWYVSGNSGSFWMGMYSGLDQNNGLLYYNTPNAIRTYDPATRTTATVYTNTTSQKLYGVRISQNKLYGVFSDSPNASGTQTYIMDLPEEEVTEPLVNGSTISAETVYTGETVTITGAATGGEGGYSYTYLLRTSQSGDWTNIGTGDSKVFEANYAGTYEFKVIVSDGTNTAEKILTLTAVDAPEPLVNESTISAETVYTGEMVTITGAATGGEGSYSYTYLLRTSQSGDWTNIGTGDSKVFEANYAGTYEFKVIVSDGTNTAEKILTLTAQELPELVNESYIGSSYISTGTRARFFGAASGGSGEYTYAYYYKRTTAKYWSTLGTEFGTDTLAVMTPALGDYDIRIAVKDSAGNVSEKTFTLNVSDGTATGFTNESTISTTGVASHTRVFLEGISSNSNCRFAFYYKRTTAKGWTTLGTEFGGVSKVAFTPLSEGEFNVKVDAIDENNRILSKIFALSVDDDYNDTGIVSSASVSDTTLKVNTRLIITASAAGGTAPYTYGYFYKQAGSNNWVQIGDYTEAETVGIKLRNVGNYIIKVVTKDSAGGMVSENINVSTVA